MAVRRANHYTKQVVNKFAVISNGMPNITVNYSDCHLTAEIVEVCMFGNKLDRCSVNLVVIALIL